MKRLACGTLVLALLLCGSSMAWAQAYKSLEVAAKDIDPDSPDTQVRIKFGQTRGAVQEYLRSKPLDDEGRALLRKFFRDAYLRSWTQPKNWTSAGANRQDFLRTFYGPLNSQADSRAFLNEIMVEFMREYIKPAYHPVLRYNAMLLLGDLRSKEMDPINQSPEVPYAPATAVILAALEDPNQSDAVKVGAWVGLLEHCELYGVNLGAMSGQDKNKVLNLVVATLNAKEAPEDSNKDAHRWMRKRAIDVAAIIGNAGRNGNLAQALDTVIGDDTLPVDMRCSAIAAKGRLTFDQQTASNMDVVKVSTDVGKTALEAIGDDVAWYDAALTEYFKTARTGGYGMGEYGMEGMGMMPAPAPARPRSTSRGRRGQQEDAMGMEGAMEYVEPPRDPLMVRIETLFRRRVKMHLDQLKHGLVGSVTQVPDDPSSLQGGLIRYAANAEDREMIAGLAKSMVAMLSQVDNEQTRELELLRASRTRLESLTTAAQRLAAKAAVELETPEALEESPDDVPGALPPGAVAPGADVPGANVPRADVPGGAMPNNVPGNVPGDVPGGVPADVPGAGVPGADVPGGAGPAADIPSADVPGGAMPAGAGPSGNGPAGNGPGADVPPVGPPMGPTQPPPADAPDTP